MRIAIMRFGLIGILGLIVTGSRTAKAGPLNSHELTLQNLFRGTPTPGFTTTFTVDSTPGAVEVPNWANVNPVVDRCLRHGANQLEYCDYRP